MRSIPPSPSWNETLARLLACTEATDLQGGLLGQDEAFTAAGSMIRQARNAGRKVMAVGNGGSAAIAAHLQTDLAHSIRMRALVFTEPSLLTAQANDHGYEDAFANQVDLWADPGDLVIAISSSGRSANILNACRRARARGAAVITYTGFHPDNPLRRLGELNFHVASGSYGPVESAHAVLIHHLTDMVLEAITAEASA